MKQAKSESVSLVDKSITNSRINFMFYEPPCLFVTEFINSRQGVASSLRREIRNLNHPLVRAVLRYRFRLQHLLVRTFMTKFDFLPCSPRGVYGARKGVMASYTRYT